MKKRMLAVLAGAMVMALNAGVSMAYTTDYTYATPLPVNGGYSSPVAGAQVETFDSSTPLWSWSGDGGSVHQAPNTGGTAPPSYQNPLAISDASNYYTVFGTTVATPTAALTGSAFNYFGLWWGSIDTFNTIIFMKGGNAILEITGQDAINPLVAGGSWTSSDNNRYVNFYGLPDFDSFEFISPGWAFEVDNIAVGNASAPVPEPGTMVLLGLGMAGLAIYGKRRQNK